MKAQAYKTISNSGGIEIAINESGELHYWHNNAGVCDEPKEAEIQFDEDGNAYFAPDGGGIEYLSEYMKVRV